MSFFNRNKQASPASSICFLIVGLGNPGAEYVRTRHNAGFLCADYIARQCGTDITKFKNKALYSEIKIGEKRGLIIKPQTYMNNSGEAVSAFSSFYKIPPQNILVLTDDINLDVGKLRIRRKGTDGGHNGMKSIIYHLGSDAFPRIKIGIGKKPHPDYDLADYVLSKFSNEELQTLSGAAEKIYAACTLILEDKTEDAMAKYNS